MLLFNKIRSLRDSSLGLISKHLMLLFNFNSRSSSVFSFIISKHLMLLFNKNLHSGHLKVEHISKHLMLLFNTSAIKKKEGEKQFQNISCYCLTAWHQYGSSAGRLFQNISCYCLTANKHKYRLGMVISKHLMLLFN